MSTKISNYSQCQFLLDCKTRSLARIDNAKMTHKIVQLSNHQLLDVLSLLDTYADVLEAQPETKVNT